MNDKYEEFKKWLSESEFHLATEKDCIVYNNEVFQEFEEEYYEKEIKQIITETIHEYPCATTTIGKHTVYLTEPIVDKIYDKLKEKGYLK